MKNKKKKKNYLKGARTKSKKKNKNVEIPNK